jgi:hypothetical protein
VPPEAGHDDPATRMYQGSERRTMLFFELFPAFMGLVMIVAGAGPYLMDARARQAEAERGETPLSPPDERRERE